MGSVNQMLKAGKSVHFESGNCYVEHATSGVRTPIEKNGTYEVGIWVRRPDVASMKRPSAQSLSVSNRFDALACDDHNDQVTGF